MNLSGLGSITQYLLQYWKTKHGFLVGLVLVAIITVHSGSALSGILFCLVWLFVWLFGSRRIIIPSPSKRTVVFSFKVDQEGEKNYRRVMSAVQQQFDQLGLSSRIRVLVGAQDLIANLSTAHKYRDRWNVDVLVWGESLYGFLEEEQVLQFKVNHTTRLSGTLAEHLEDYLSEVGLFLVNRRWTIHELNELEDLVVVADEFLETILGVIGINLWVRNEINDSLAIFESVLLKMARRTQSGEASLNTQRNKRVQEIVCEISFRKAQNKLETADYDEAIRLLEHIKRALPKSTVVLMSLAYASYHSGDIDKAKEYTWALGGIDKRHPAVAINVAFFSILENNYDRAGYWYSRLLNMKEIKEADPLSTAAFLEKEYEARPTEHALLYGLAVVNGLVDPEIRERDLKRFLQLTRERPEYSSLRNRAIALLSSDA